MTYNGYDTYKKIIDFNKDKYLLNNKFNFFHLDFYSEKEKIMNADLCIIKDVLQHWSLEYINLFLEYLVNSKKFKFILLCNCCYQERDNTDIKNGDFRFLSCKYLPLKHFNPVEVFKYKSKEVSLIKI